MEHVKRIALILLLALPAWAGDITTGYTWANGEQVTASKMNAMVGSAVINSTFYTTRSAITAPGGAETILVYDSSAGAFKKITINTLLTRTNLITSLLPAGTLTTNDQLMVVNGGALASVTVSNLGVDLAPYIPFTDLSLGLTNLSQLNAANPMASNQVYYLCWSNASPRAMSFSNLLSSGVGKLGTNDMVPYLYQWNWNPLVYNTNTSRYAITNLYHTNGAYALSNMDTVPIHSTIQGSNTTLRMDALYQYLTNLSALPTYTLARATFEGTVASAVLSNAVDTTSEYVYAVHGLSTGNAVSMVNNISPASLPAASPALTTNQIYWVSNVNSFTLMLFTNRNDCLAGTNAVNITGAGANTSTLFWVTNRSLVNCDVTAVTTGVTKDVGHYDVWFRSPANTTNYYVLGGGMRTTYNCNVGVSENYEPNTNKVRITTFRYDANEHEFRRVQVSIQPE